ncbi:3-phosphoshikimate 1-carboxyvinyltransferase [Formicincola oecophyllae]|uniref:3-phosphoshikimate 1-carboxyvinyltransferase n=1 Tax=Formicincola oecophyllae TaxID=2558361 RepID=A0A4Y6UB70_9PROT|nr:3-phosphoshikimate 1-carboxyvinyltransferase [Formicincola oecophyllae]QDH13641.1 3-phosphoshikimate 1-carboxyvinyltransferase [Formicincola oecophyllae]
MSEPAPTPSARTPIAHQASPAAAPLRGAVRVPGDKSISHRAIMMGALAEGTTTIEGLLEGADVMATIRAMRQLGATVTQGDGPGMWRVVGWGRQGPQEPADVLDMGNAGTGARLLAGLLAPWPLTAFLTGDGSLRKRPMKRVTAPLGRMGVGFATRAGDRLPMAIQGTVKGRPITYRLPVASAQVKSALMLAGLNCQGETVVIEPSPTRDHTENMLRHFGVPVSVEDTERGRTIRLTGPATLRAVHINVPGDPSSAAFPLVAALLVPGSDVRIENVGLNPLRTGLLTTLREMGADLQLEDVRDGAGEAMGTLHARHSALKAVDVPAERAPSMIDEYPILAMACAMAAGTSRLRGLEELRVKESDRLAATLALLQGNGVKAWVEGDDLFIEGSGGDPVPGGGVVATHMDHRLAMSAVVMGLASQKGLEVDDLSFVDTSFPGFLQLLGQLQQTPVGGKP